jgi:murein DD-endopeptidase MepM/ murein hydrolase activator NlpD
LKTVLICLFVLGFLNAIPHENPSKVGGKIIIPADATEEVNPSPKKLKINKEKLVRRQLFSSPYPKRLKPSRSPYKGSPKEKIYKKEIKTKQLKQSPKLYRFPRLIMQVNPYARQKLKLNIVKILGNSYPITSGYGWRKDPIRFRGRKLKIKTYKYHNGIDIGTPTGTPIYSPVDAIVSEIHYKTCSGGGRKIYLDHYNGYQTVYMHLSTIIIKEGQYIKKGQLIGYTGMSGFRVTGPHLHLEVKRDGIHLNPYRFLEN